MEQGDSPSSARSHRSDPRPPPLARHRLVVPVVIVHALVMFLWSLFRHHNFGSSTDLGAYHSVAWNFATNGSLWNSVDLKNFSGLAPVKAR